MSSHERSRDGKSRREDRSEVSTRKHDAARKRSCSREAADRHNATAASDAKTSTSKKHENSSQAHHSDSDKRNSHSSKSKGDSSSQKVEASKSKSEHDKHRSNRDKSTNQTVDSSEKHESHSTEHAKSARKDESQSRHDSQKRKSQSSKQNNQTPDADKEKRDVDANVSDTDPASDAKRRRNNRFLPPPSDAPVKFVLPSKAKQVRAGGRVLDEDEHELGQRRQDEDVLCEPDCHVGEFSLEESRVSALTQPQSAKSGGDNLQIVFDSSTSTRVVEPQPTDSLASAKVTEAAERAADTKTRDHHHRSRRRSSSHERKATDSHHRGEKSKAEQESRTAPAQTQSGNLTNCQASQGESLPSQSAGPQCDSVARTDGRTESKHSRSHHSRHEKHEKSDANGAQNGGKQETAKGSQNGGHEKPKDREATDSSVQLKRDASSPSKSKREHGSQHDAERQQHRRHGASRRRRPRGRRNRNRNRGREALSGSERAKIIEQFDTLRRTSRRRSRSHSAGRRQSHRRDRRRSSSSSSTSSSSSSSSSSGSSRSRSSSSSHSRERYHRRDDRRARDRKRSGERSRSRNARRSRERSPRRRSASSGRRRRASPGSRSGTRRAPANPDGHSHPVRTSSTASARPQGHEVTHQNEQSVRRDSHRQSQRSRSASVDDGVHRWPLADAVQAPKAAVALNNDEYELRVAQFLMHTHRSAPQLGEAQRRPAEMRSSDQCARLAHPDLPTTPTDSVSASSIAPSTVPSSTALPHAQPGKGIDLQTIVASLSSLKHPVDPTSELHSGGPLSLGPAFDFGLSNIAAPVSHAPFAASMPLHHFGGIVCQQPSFVPVAPFDKTAGSARTNGLAGHVAPSGPFAYTSVRPDCRNEPALVSFARQHSDISCPLPLDSESAEQLVCRTSKPLDRSLSISQSSTSALDCSQHVKPKARWMNMLSESDSSASPPPPPPPNAQPETSERRCSSRLAGLRKSEPQDSRRPEAEVRKLPQENPLPASSMIYSRTSHQPLFELIYQCELPSGRPGRSLRARRQRAIRRMVCVCSVDDAVPCGTGCLNRMLFIECGADCPCGDACTNRQFQQRRYAPVGLFRAGSKGLGLVALATMEPDTFLMEYLGELLDTQQFSKRVREYDRSGKMQHHYFMQLNSELIIDATRKGNLSRFFNHSCDPNCETQKWTVNGQLRVGFFTQRRVERGEELTFDYQFQLYGDQQQKCHCGSPKCRGYLGTVRRAPQADTPVTLSNGPDTSTSSSKLIRSAKAALGASSLEQFGASEIEDAIRKLVARARTGLRTSEQTLQLCRLFMRAERPQDRRALLDLLLLTAEHTDLSADPLAPTTPTVPPTDSVNAQNGLPSGNADEQLLESRSSNCFVNLSNAQNQLRTFVNYHGLRILRMMLSDVRTASCEQEPSLDSDCHADLRLALLRVLRVLPIVYKKEVVESNVRSLLERWLSEIIEKQKSDGLAALADTPVPLNTTQQETVECEKSLVAQIDATDTEEHKSKLAKIDQQDSQPSAELSATPLALAVSTSDCVTTATIATSDDCKQLELAAEGDANADTDAVKCEKSEEDGQKESDAQTSSGAGTSNDVTVANVDYEAEYRRIIEELFVKWQCLKDDPYKIPKRLPSSQYAPETHPPPSVPKPSAPAPAPAPSQPKRSKKECATEANMQVEMKRQLFEASERIRVKAEKLQAERNALLKRVQSQLVRLLNETFSNGFVTLHDDEPTLTTLQFCVDSVTQRVGLMEEEGRMFTELVQLGKPSDASQNQRLAVIPLERPTTIGVSEPGRYTTMQFLTATDLLISSATSLLGAASGTPLAVGADSSLINQLQADPSLISAALSSLIGFAPPEDPQAAPASSVPPSVSTTTLPANWASAQSDDGRTYYYHSVTRKTQWTFPTAEEDAEESRKTGADSKTNRSPSPVQSYGSSSSGLLNFASREADAADRKALKALISETVVKQLSKLRTRHASSLTELSDATQFKDLARRLSYSIYEKELKRMLATHKLSRIRLEADEDSSRGANAATESRKERKRARKKRSERENVKRKTKNFIVRYVHVKLEKVSRRRKRAAKTRNAESPGSAAESGNQNESVNLNGSASHSASESNHANSSKRLEARLSRMCAGSDSDSDASDADVRLFESAWKKQSASQSENEFNAEPNRNGQSDTHSPAASSSLQAKLADQKQ